MPRGGAARLGMPAIAGEFARATARAGRVNGAPAL
jgi:hypothetical protein